MCRIEKFIFMALLLSGIQSAEAQSDRYSEYPFEYGGIKKGVFVVDAGGRTIRSLETGSSLHIGAAGLRPNTMYEFRLGTDKRVIQSLREAVSFARSGTDKAGNIRPFILWYETGVVGCAKQGIPKIPMAFRTFEEAGTALIGKVLTISAHAVERDTTGRIPPMKLRVGEAEYTLQVPIIPRRSPAVYASDPNGCLVNSQLTGDADLYISGTHFKPGEVLEISMVPNQRSWRVGDPINDVTGASYAAQSEKVTVGSDGRFTVKVWDRANQRQGVYDMVAHRSLPGQPERVVHANDIVSYLAETGFILFLRYPVGGPTMDIAGRPISGIPYFEFADSFADTGDPVWGAVDPTYVPTGHAGGSYAAYYVVNHRSVTGWDPASGGSINLVDVSGGIEIWPVKATCVNGTEHIIWNTPLTVGQYDVVVDFGSTAATTPETFSTDGQYNDATDFLDGADQIGFSVLPDPYTYGSFPIGQDTYSQDDFFPNIGATLNVDLRAVVRYPATSAGTGTPVSAGQHPLFIIEHGNHSFCNVSGYTHDTCPSRKLNHMGYMGLLDRLASHGIIAVSIDAYDMTGVSTQWIAERSDLILKHLELWSHMNNTATYTSYPDFFSGRFANHVDMTKISVSGHSRGGEASVGAYMRNTAFNIISVSSIAPVDGQVYILPDVPYFVILPAADGDVYNLSGMKIYDRAGSTLPTPDGTTKSGIDVYGASHNFFNTVWAADGDDGAAGRDDYIPAADQQRLGEMYLIAFARVHLNSEAVYEDLFRGKLKFPSTAGRKIYPFRHEKAHSKIENGTGSGTASGGATVTSVSSPSVHSTQAIRIGWASSSAQYTYTVPLSQRDASSFEVLSFRAAQTNSASNPASGNQNFQVELVGGGYTKAVYEGQFGAIPKPYNRSGTDQNVMTTVRIPLHSFIMNHAGVTLDNIDTIRFKFNSPTSGEIYVDDIEFSR